MNPDLFDRIPLSWRSGIEAGRALLAPLGIPFPRARFLCNVSPAFVGLHSDVGSDDGRPYAITAHCVWPCNLRHRPADDRLSTISIPIPYARLDAVVLHELAHVLHDDLRARSGTWDVGVELPGTTAYSYKNYWELFAEAVEILAGATAQHEYYSDWFEKIHGEEWRPLRELLRWPTPA